MKENSKLIEALEAVKEQLLPKEEPKYATSEELSAMKDEIMELLTKNKEEAVQEELSEVEETEEVEAVEEEAEAEEVEAAEEAPAEEEVGVAELAEVERPTHSPEKDSELLSRFKWGQKRPERMIDRILTKLYA
jgi:hypothetical protein